jgi:methylenetetrahydrofolate dehydrogenase (NADP+)/methenyltetrahydrofolate cyclohydrolase
MSCTIVDGRKIAETIRQKVALEVKQLVSTYKTPPNIVTLKIGQDASSELYMKLRDTACTDVGIQSTHQEFSEKVTERELISAIHTLNMDPGVHGILIQFPLPGHISSENIIATVHPVKDVEGFTPFNMGRTLFGVEDLVPCTPLSVLTILDHEQVDIMGKAVVIVNHSTVVGKPLTALFLNRNATVSICHVYTKDITPYTSRADILVTAAGVPGLITSDHVKAGAVVVDVGIVPTKDGGVCGDVDVASVKHKAGMLTPVPGGVGPVTIACCLQNMVKTYQGCMEHQR